VPFVSFLVSYAQAFNIKNHGALKDEKNINTIAIPKAVDA
jgi:hypothetical protein